MTEHNMTASALTLTTLNHLGLLKIDGPDSRKFLQGQVTNDTQSINTQQLLHGAHCTPKGRMIANFDSFATGDESVYLRLYADVLPKLQQSLAKYIVFSKAALSDESGNFEVFGLQGEGAESSINALFHTQLSDDNAIAYTEKVLLLRLDSTRIEIWVTQDHALPHPLQDMRPTSEFSDQWIKADIDAGKGWVCERTSEEFLPQSLNLDHPNINGINFKKGCYTGQEIIARLHYKGKSKRHMHHLTGASIEAPLNPGDPIYNGEGKTVGHVVNSTDLNGDCELLASVNDSDVEASSLFLDSSKLLPLRVKPMAYTPY